MSKQSQCLDTFPNQTCVSGSAQSSVKATRETAKHLSRLTGTTTVVKEQVTTSGRGVATSVSRSTQVIQRPLLTADEVLRIKCARKDSRGFIAEPGDMVVYVAGYPAIYGVQPLYFRDAELLRRAKLPSTLADNAQTKQILA